MRIATVITRLEGGAGLHALRGARAMNSAAFQMTIITGSGGRLLDEAAQAGLEVVVESSLRAPIDPRGDLRALRRLGMIFRDVQFDVAHTHTAKAGTLGRLAAHRAGIPRIVHTYHGFPFHEFQRAPRRRAYVAIERRLGRITDLALCVGTGVAVEAVRRELIAPERIRTIGVVVAGADEAWAGFPVAGIPVAAPLARRRARLALGLAADATVVGTVGRLTYQKAPEDFLAALRRLGRPGVIGVWIGGGELAGRVADLAAAMPEVSVVLAGERTDVPELLPAFDVFALSSLYEGLPTVVVEAMVCGVPVVATAVNAVADVVVPGETGLLVPPRRPELMAEAIGFLLDSPAAATRMTTAARAAGSVNRRSAVRSPRRTPPSPGRADPRTRVRPRGPDTTGPARPRPSWPSPHASH
jgi:glycosyltransferase involved in cell wall biosynthesis